MESKFLSEEQRDEGGNLNGGDEIGKVADFSVESKSKFVMANFLIMERVDGIEPTSSAWKAAALPLCYTRAIISISIMSKNFGNRAFQNFLSLYPSC